jgi:hypothetical protein
MLGLRFMRLGDAAIAAILDELPALGAVLGAKSQEP